MLTKHPNVVIALPPKRSARKRAKAAPIGTTPIEAATHQLATAIWLYFEDRDLVSVHTLATAALELIEQECKRQGHNSLLNDFFNRIRPDRCKEIRDRLYEARNLFKHGARRPRRKGRAVVQPHIEFSDDLNFWVLVCATHGLRLLGVHLLEARLFGAWVGVVEPNFMLSPPPKDVIIPIFRDIGNKPRAEQKRIGRDVLHFSATDTD